MLRDTASILPLRLLATGTVLVLCLGSCAVLKAASKASEVFTREEDPTLAAAALPTFIKASEILLEADPTSQDKIVATASLYVMYASAFVDGGTEFLPESRFEEREAAVRRAGALYRRAFRLLKSALERRSPGFLAAVGGDREAAALARFTAKDISLLYWSSAAILAGFGLNPLDFESAAQLNTAGLMLKRAEALDPGWGGGSIYEILLPYYASLPTYLGGDPTKAEEAYAKALEYSKGGSASLFVSYATAICAAKGDLEGYKAALERALAIDPNAKPDSRLATVLAQARARRLLDEAWRYFDIDSGG